MRAFTIEAYGQSLRAANVPEPTPHGSEVLVEIHAASVNQLDAKIASGEFRSLLPYPMPLVLGHDLAGLVTAVGPDATRFSVGDAVYGRVRDGRIGTFAERIAVDQDDVALMPASLSMREAASLPLVALTAWQALVDIGKVGPGDKVLIHAGTGGVGSIAIQLAKHLGATVATTASQGQAQTLRDLGADVVIDYRNERFEELVRDYDFVLDSIGGDHVLRSVRVLRTGGRVVGIAGPPTPDFARAEGGNMAVRVISRLISSKVRREARKRHTKYSFLWVRANGQQLAALARLIDDGAISPIVADEYSFDETPVAVAALGQSGRVGKVVIFRS